MPRNTLSETRQALNRLEGFVAYAQEMIPNNQLKSRAERVRGDWMLVQESVERAVIVIQELEKLRTELLDSDREVRYPTWFFQPEDSYQLELFAEGRQESIWADMRVYGANSEELWAGMERLVQDALACSPPDEAIRAGVRRFVERRGGPAPTWEALIDEAWELCERWRRDGRREPEPERPVEFVPEPEVQPISLSGRSMVPRESCDCDMCSEARLLQEGVPMGPSGPGIRPEQALLREVFNALDDNGRPWVVEGSFDRPRRNRGMDEEARG